MERLLFRLFAAVLLLAVPVGAALGEDPAVELAPGQRPGSDRGVREVGPELFYMENEAGRLVPVPGFRYRDFVDLFRMKEGLAGPLEPPAAVLENVVVTIDARPATRVASAADRAGAACPARVECTVKQSRPGWAMIPLELGSVMLSAPPRHEGPGRMIIDADPDGRGYRGWFDAPLEAGAEATHTLILEGSIAADTGTAQEMIAVDLPTAVASLVEIKSSRSEPAVAVEPAPPRERVTTAAEGEGSSISIAGLAGRVRIRIASARADRPARGAAAQAVSESIVRIDGRNVVVEATLALENLPADASRLSITLPPGMTLRDMRSGGTLVARGGTADRPTIEVAVDVGPQGRAVLELTCEGAVGAIAPASCQPLGFAVAGIENWRQWGRMSLLVDGDWRVTWNETTAVRRVDPPANAREPGFVAAFAFDTQPASLALQVRPRESRMVVEPEYRYQVGGSRIVLEARLRVSARGASIGGIGLSLDDSWSVDEVGPVGEVDQAGLVQERTKVVIPFATAFTGDTVVELRASRPIARDADRVVWKLPTPVPGAPGSAVVVGSATVVISAESDIELVPDATAINGLVRQTAAALGDVDETGLVYRLDVKDGAFAATRRYLPRRVAAEIEARASIDAGEIVVEETIAVDVLHVPLEFIELSVPADLIEPGSFKVRQGDEPLQPTEVAADPAAGDAAGSVTGLRAILARPLLGAGTITVQYRLDTPSVPPESTVAVDLPLAIPVGATVERQTVNVTSAGSLTVGVRGETWRSDAVDAAAGRQSWSAPRPQQRLPLSIAARRLDARRAMMIDAAWLQTRLLPGVREDIWSYAISAAGDRIVVVLPGAGAGRMPATCEVRLDGRVLPAAPRGDGRVVVDLPRGEANRRLRLDIATTQPHADGWGGLAPRLGMPGTVSLDPPTFEGGAVERRFYWSVHVRPDEHLVGMPTTWTSQQAWRRGPLGWRLEPLVGSPELAAWLDEGVAAAADPAGSAPARAAAPPLVERTFVYAGVGATNAARPWIVPTWCVVLVSSGLALVAGLAAVYRPSCRRVPVVVAVAAAVGLAAAAFPEVAPLAIQAALPGAGLATVAATLRGLSARDTRRAPASAFSASSLTRSRGLDPSLIVTSSVAEAIESARQR
jgi:hypothetical protein